MLITTAVHSNSSNNNNNNNTNHKNNDYQPYGTENLVVLITLHCFCKQLWPHFWGSELAVILVTILPAESDLHHISHYLDARETPGSPRFPLKGRCRHGDITLDDLWGLRKSA